MPVYYGLGQYAEPARHIGKQHRTTKIDLRITGRTTARDNDRHSGRNESGRAELNRQSSFELRRDIAQYRGAAYPLCFIDEVMEH